MIVCRDGAIVAVLNFPLFLGLRVGSAGLVLRCFTVTVKNDEDEERTAFSESDVPGPVCAWLQRGDQLRFSSSESRGRCSMKTIA